MHQGVNEFVLTLFSQTIYQESGVKKHWMAVRYAAALQRKVVDCLAPSMTAMLVRGKEVRRDSHTYVHYPE